MQDDTRGLFWAVVDLAKAVALLLIAMGILWVIIANV